MMTRAPADKPELQRWILLLGDADRRILAQSWGLPPDSEPAVLVSAMTDPERVREQWECLLPAEQDALVRVLQAGGALPVAILQREWGVVRDHHSSLIRAPICNPCPRRPRRPNGCI